MKPQGGTTANASGKTGEQLIVNQLMASGYVEASQEDHHLIRAALLAGVELALLVKPGTYYRQLPAFRSIYGVPFKADFVIAPLEPAKPVLVEMKYQSSAGSVDEKLPFWLLSLEALSDKVQPVLVIFGDGCRQGAIEWCHEYLRAEKNTRVFSSPKTFAAYAKTL